MNPFESIFFTATKFTLSSFFPSTMMSRLSKTSFFLIGAFTPKFFEAINSNELNSGFVRVT